MINTIINTAISTKYTYSTLTVTAEDEVIWQFMVFNELLRTVLPKYLHRREDYPPLPIGRPRLQRLHCSPACVRLCMRVWGGGGGCQSICLIFIHRHTQIATIVVTELIVGSFAWFLFIVTRKSPPLVLPNWLLAHIIWHVASNRQYNTARNMAKLCVKENKLSIWWMCYYCQDTVITRFIETRYFMKQWNYSGLTKMSDHMLTVKRFLYL